MSIIRVLHDACFCALLFCIKPFLQYSWSTPACHSHSCWLEKHRKLYSGSCQSALRGGATVQCTPDNIYIIIFMIFETPYLCNHTWEQFHFFFCKARTRSLFIAQKVSNLPDNDKIVSSNKFTQRLVTSVPLAKWLHRIKLQSEIVDTYKYEYVRIHNCRQSSRPNTRN